MNIVVTEYVEKLFENAPQTRDILDIKEELLYNLNEKFEDLTNRGMSKEDAFLQVTSGIGNIQELILEAQKPKSRMYSYAKPVVKKEGSKEGMSKETQKSITGMIISSMWMLVAVVYVFMIMYARNTIFGRYVYTHGWLIFLVAVAVQAAFFIFMTLPSLNSVNTELPDVETESDRIMLLKKRKKLIGKIVGHISTIIWMAAVTLYMIISFISRAWHVTWVIFVIAAVVQNFLVQAAKMYENRV